MGGIYGSVYVCACEQERGGWMCDRMNVCTMVYVCMAKCVCLLGVWRASDYAYSHVVV